MRLTEAAQRLLPEARAVLVAVERARRIAPDVPVELVDAPTRARLERVRAGQLDAAFGRGVDEVTDLELIPLWHGGQAGKLTAD